MILIVQETAKRHGRFDGWIEGSQVVIPSSPQPFLDAARELIRRNVGSGDNLDHASQENRNGLASWPDRRYEASCRYPRSSPSNHPSCRLGPSLASLANNLNFCRAEIAAKGDLGPFLN